MLTDIFADDHKNIEAHISELLASLRANRASREELKSFRKSVRRHLYFEETTLFPAALTEENRSRINGLEVEHGGIWQLLDKIEEYINTGDLIRAIDRTEGLVRLFKNHVENEYEIVYRQLNKRKDLDNKTLKDQFNNQEIPEDWTCRVLRKYRK